jgi:DNA-binding transcriptional MerR regulator
VKKDLDNMSLESLVGVSFNPLQDTLIKIIAQLSNYERKIKKIHKHLDLDNSTDSEEEEKLRAKKRQYEIDLLAPVHTRIDKFEKMITDQSRDVLNLKGLLRGRIHSKSPAQPRNGMVKTMSKDTGEFESALGRNYSRDASSPTNLDGELSPSNVANELGLINMDDFDRRLHKATTALSANLQKQF